jgi:hypothetical protein
MAIIVANWLLWLSLVAPTVIMAIGGDGLLWRLGPYIARGGLITGRGVASRRWPRGVRFEYDVL